MKNKKGKKEAENQAFVDIRSQVARMYKDKWDV